MAAAFALALFSERIVIIFVVQNRPRAVLNHFFAGRGCCACGQPCGCCSTLSRPTSCCRYGPQASPLCSSRGCCRPGAACLRFGQGRGCGRNGGGRCECVLPGVRAANASARHHHCGRGGCEPPTPQGLLPLRLRPQARLAAHLIAAPQSVSASVRILPLAGTFWTFFGLPAGGFLHSLEGFGQYGGIWQSRFLH